MSVVESRRVKRGMRAEMGWRSRFSKCQERGSAGYLETRMKLRKGHAIVRRRGKVWYSIEAGYVKECDKNEEVLGEERTV